ncbi:Fe-S protein assembly co-chaperone HscB [Actinobacillus vicugnae]|uniref:Fe-S protein assembly co-chaperone HscB n=1 Tax=Actinobacillus vicugnae TaxID=2573093 RepID=UPI0012414E5E|nr:Fe-S protein assembly co-chaperone HscB [Actinobacillus vicugnae]
MNNPFALFDLPVQFQLDNALLSERYLALQKQLHPDNFAKSSATEQLAAVQKSADVNAALQTLKDPILRAEALIEIQTGEVKNLEEKSMRDVEFLMQQMEWHEKLEMIEHRHDETELTAFLKQIKSEQKSVLEQLEKTLEAQQWQQANALTDRLRYFKKLIIQIEKVEEKFFDM